MSRFLTDEELLQQVSQPKTGGQRVLSDEELVAEMSGTEATPPADAPGLGERFLENLKAGFRNTLIGQNIMARQLGAGELSDAAEAAVVLEDMEARGLEQSARVPADPRVHTPGYGFTFPGDEAMRFGRYAGRSREELEAGRDESIAEAGRKRAENLPGIQEAYRRYEQMPGFHEEETLGGQVSHGAAALIGQIIGGTPTPESVVPVGRGATVGRTFARGAGSTAGVAAAVEPVIQQREQQMGVREETSVAEGALNTAISGVIGGVLNVSPNAVRAIRDLIAGRQGKAPEQVTPEDIQSESELVREAFERAGREGRPVEEVIAERTGTDRPDAIDRSTLEGRKTARSRERELGETFQQAEVARRRDLDPETGELVEGAEPVRDPTGTARSTEDLATSRQARDAMARAGISEPTPAELRGAEAMIRAGEDPEIITRAFQRAGRAPDFREVGDMRAETATERNRQYAQPAFDIAAARRQRRDADIAADTPEGRRGQDYQAGGRTSGVMPDEQFAYLDPVVRDGQMISGEEVRTGNVYREVAEYAGGPKRTERAIIRGDGDEMEWVPAERVKVYSRPESPRQAQDFKARAEMPPRGAGKTTTPGPLEATDRISTRQVAPIPIKEGPVIEGRRGQPDSEPPPRQGETFEGERGAVRGMPTPEPRRPEPAEQRRIEGPERAPEPEPTPEPEVSARPFEPRNAQEELLGGAEFLPNARLPEGAGMAEVRAQAEKYGLDGDAVEGLGANAREAVNTYTRGLKTFDANLRDKAPARRAQEVKRLLDNEAFRRAAADLGVDPKGDRAQAAAEVAKRYTLARKGTFGDEAEGRAAVARRDRNLREQYGDEYTDNITGAARRQEAEPQKGGNADRGQRTQTADSGRRETQTEKPESFTADMRERAKKHGLDVMLTERGDTVTVQNMVAPKEQRGQGAGTAFMDELTAEADRQGKTLALTPSGDLGGSPARLRRFYKRHGFVENKGKNKDFEVMEAMVRRPQKANEAPATEANASVPPEYRGSGGTFYSGIPVPELGKAAAALWARSGDIGRAAFGDIEEWGRVGERLSKLAEAVTAATARNDEKESAVGHLARAFWYDNHARLKSLAKRHNSPTLQSLADSLYKTAGEGSGTADTFDTRVGRRLNTRSIEIDKLQKHLKAHKLEGERAQEQIIRMVESGNISGRSPMHKAAQMIHEFLADELEYLHGAGVEVARAKNYFPRGEMDANAVWRNSKRFIAQATKAYQEMGMSRDDADSAARAYFDGIMYGEQGTPGHMNRSSGASPSFLKQRTFTPKAAAMLDEFRVRDIQGILAKYMNGATRRAEIARLSVTTADGETLRVGENWRNWDRVVKAMRAEDDGIEASMEEILLTVQTGVGIRQKSYNHQYRAGTSWLRTLASLGLLEMAAVSSLGELLIAPMRAASGNMVGDTGQMIKNLHWTIGEGARRVMGLGESQRWKEASKLAEDLGIIAGEGYNSVMASRWVSGDPVGRAQADLINRFFRTTRLEQLTNATGVSGLINGQVFLRRLSKNLLEDGQQKSKFFLRELGVPEGKEAEFARYVAKFADRAPGMDELDGDMGKLYQNAMFTFVEQTRMRPTANTKPSWASTPLGAIVFQLQSFAYAFTKNVLMRQARIARSAAKGTDDLQLRDAAAIVPAVVMGFASITAMQTLLGEARRQASGDDRPETAWAKIERGISYSGAFGKLDPYINLVSGVRYQKSPGEQLMGPALGSLNDAVASAIGLSVGNSDKTDTAERNATKEWYRFLAEPAMQVLISQLPIGYFSTGLATLGPRTLERAVVDLAGEKTERREMVRQGAIEALFNDPQPVARSGGSARSGRGSRGGRTERDGR